MTVDVIDHKLTKVLTCADRKDITLWANPSISLLIGSNGLLYDWSPLVKDGKTIVKVGRDRNSNVSDTVSLTLYKSNGTKKQWTSTFNGLFARAVLGVNLRGKTLIKLIEKDGYTPENVQVVGIKELIKIRQAKVAPRELNPPKTLFSDNDHLEDYCKESTRGLPKPDLPTEEEFLDSFRKSIENSPKGSVTVGTLVAIGFVRKNTKPEKFITEDGAKFPTKSLADWHQEKVDKGKTNAEIVLSYKGGWSLAEKIYLQEVNYGDNPKPYENFRDVFEQDLGVVSVLGTVTYTIVDYPRKDELNLDIPEELSHDDAVEILRNISEVCRLKDELEKKLEGLTNGKTPTLAG